MPADGGRRRTATARRFTLAAPLAHCYDRPTTARQRQRRARDARRDGERDPRQRRRAQPERALRAAAVAAHLRQRADAERPAADARRVRVNDLLWAGGAEPLRPRPDGARLRDGDRRRRRDDRALRRRRRRARGCRPATTTCARPTARASASRATSRRGKLTNLLSRPLGVTGASNPEPATGGEDPETIDEARGQRAAHRADARSRRLDPRLRGLRARLRRHRQGARAVDSRAGRRAACS